MDLVVDGSFCLDGGAMFGVVPKPLWERLLPSDERNRIRLGLNCLLVRGAREVIFEVGGHYCYRRHPERWNKLVDAFLADAETSV